MKKNIILYINNDEIFTLPIVICLIQKFSKSYNFSIKLSNTSLIKKIKIILIIILDGSFRKLFSFYKKRINLKKILEFKNVKIIEEEKKKKYKFGLSVNYPKKILNKNFPIYNFHFGNFKTQRGTFIFFYKKIFSWNTIDLTFHKINDDFDSGKIINKRKINVEKLKSLELIALPLKHKDFYINSIFKINKKIKNKKIKNIQSLNKEPSFLKILFN